MIGAILTSMVLAGVPAAVAQPNASIHIVAVHGVLDINRGPGLTGATAVASANAANTLAPGDRLLLREKSSVSLQDPSGSLQFVGPGEATVVSAANYVWQGDRATLNASGGTLQINVEGGGVHVGNGEARLRRGPQGIIVESLGAQQVVLMGPGGIATLKPGSGTLLQAAGPGAKLESLPAAPQLLLPGPSASLRAFRFKWRSMPEAARYRLELARDPQFQDIIYAQDTTANVIADTAHSLPVGLLYWRVATENAHGFEGIPSDARAIRVAP